ncbi:SRPBCC family protein [Streptomyces uncialis]|uniref:SRPBCC family protein n=1 Tax=Streptomyces uncialis TaxID=1048205 RepID=UPI0022592A0D|nr:SRPBCC family protein [Streptomyces uncialis]MCX4662699.1 SRPBCC family protein [Streptomyces uncialis]WST71422.1 SRPBCC family protein [Streptomyces uncialis]WTE09914.1 SRPBCC family protein [Streptomyces uncialis]
MDWCRYRFLSRWDLPAPPDAVFAVLERAEDYPRWWPQVRSVTGSGTSGTGGTGRFRSFLPYELVVTATETRRDRAAGVLEIAMSGDLDGWARWTLRPGGAGTIARYEQEVEVRKPLMRGLAVPGRPLFLLNHAWMMRGGRRGLTALLRSP